MDVKRTLRAGVHNDLLYHVSTHKDHCVAHSAVLWISAQLTEMLDCIAAGDSQNVLTAVLQKNVSKAGRVAQSYSISIPVTLEGLEISAARATEVWTWRTLLFVDNFLHKQGYLQPVVSCKWPSRLDITEEFAYHAHDEGLLNTVWEAVDLCSCV